MRIRLPKRKGIVFLSVLIITVLTVMMMTAALVLLPSGRSYGAATQQEQLAKAAAQAGVEYAMSRLVEDPAWRGDSNSVVVNIPNEIWVRESQGNVVGILWAPNGTKSVFRVRFNHQNNLDDPQDNFPNPPADMEVAHKYVSVNNLGVFGSRPLHRATGTGFAVPTGSTPVANVPADTAVIYSEGLAGPAVRGVSPTALAPDPTAGAVTSRVVEAYIGNDTDAFGTSVMYGADDIDFDLTGTMAVTSLDGTSTSQAATLGSMSVTSPDPNPISMTNGGEVYVEPGTGRFLVNGVDSTAPSATQQDTSSNFVQMGWGNLAQPSSSDPRMQAGTYVWRNGPGGPELDYYAEDYDPATFPSTSPVATNLSSAALTNTGTGITLNNGDMRMDISENIQVETVGGVTGLAVVPETGIMGLTGTRPKTKLVAASATAPAPILAVPGDIQFEGAVAGQGSIKTQGSLRLQGTSVLESHPDSEVALFAKGDITIDAVPEEVLPSLGGAGNPIALVLPAAGSPAPTTPTTTVPAAPPSVPTTTVPVAPTTVAPIAPTTIPVPTTVPPGITGVPSGPSPPSVPSTIASMPGIATVPGSPGVPVTTTAILPAGPLAPMVSPLSSGPSAPFSPSGPTGPFTPTGPSSPILSAGSLPGVVSPVSGPSAPVPGTSSGAYVPPNPSLIPALAASVTSGGFTVGADGWDGIIVGGWGGGWGPSGVPPWLGPDPGLAPSKAEDVAFVGVVYTQGDFNVNLDPTPGGLASRGNFMMRGVLVAYGGDYEPGSGVTPGSSGKGRIGVIADNVSMTHDSSFVSHLSNSQNPPVLKIVSWRGF